MAFTQRFVGRLIIVAIGLWIVHHVTMTELAKPTTPPNPCVTDFLQCANNSDMANNYSGWDRAKSDCQSAAEKLAKYGTPEWPSYSWAGFYRGDDYKSGVIRLFEANAKFQNAFGAMARVHVACQYNLKTMQVLDIGIR
jgi:hypothetical protein